MIITQTTQIPSDNIVSEVRRTGNKGGRGGMKAIISKYIYRKSSINIVNYVKVYLFVAMHRLQLIQVYRASGLVYTSMNGH